MAYLDFFIVGIVALLFVFLVFLICKVYGENRERYTPDWPFYLLLICSFLILLAETICMSESQNVLPVVVETISEPQIDTTITILDNVSDTSYTYTFFNTIIE